MTLWAVDEGVPLLTGYDADPLDLIYQAAPGLGTRLAGDLVSVAPPVPEEQRERATPAAAADTTPRGCYRCALAAAAFFLRSVGRGKRQPWWGPCSPTTLRPPSR